MVLHFLNKIVVISSVLSCLFVRLLSSSDVAEGVGTMSNVAGSNIFSPVGLSWPVEVVGSQVGTEVLA